MLEIVLKFESTSGGKWLSLFWIRIISFAKWKITRAAYKLQGKETFPEAIIYDIMSCVSLSTHPFILRSDVLLL